PARAGRAGSRLVGRLGELDLLEERWGRAATGRPGLVLLRGDAGVGKTRLMTEAAERVRRAVAVVAGARCFGTAGRLALAPVADWLRTPAIRSALTDLDPVWRTEVERLVPTTRTRDGPGPPAMVDAWQRHRFYEGLARGLLHSGRPVLLTIDNLHWCDPETLAFVTFVLGPTPDTPVLVVATMRDDPDDHEPGLDRWITRMQATGLLTEVPVTPFDAADTATLVEALTGRAPDPGAAAELQATTGGFPLYIVESARAGAAAGPAPGSADRADGVTAVLVRRLQQLSPPAGELAGLGAAVGRDFTLDLLTEAADLDPDTVVRAVDELWRARILRETGDGYDFSHDLLREAAYAQVSPPRRWLLHRRVAQSLEILHTDDPEAVSAQLAEQYARGGNAERAIGYYRRAAAVAAGMFAHSEAVRLLEEALALVRTLPEGPGRTRRELALLEAMAAPLNAQFGYSSARVRETLEGAVARAELLGDREAQLNGLVGLWTSLFVHGDTEEAHRTAGRALALVEPGSELSGPAHFAFGGSALSLGRPAEALEHLQHAVEFGGYHPLSIGTRSDVHGRAFAAHAHWLLGDPQEALATSRDAIALARTTGNPFVLAVALAYGAITHQLRDDRADLRRVVDELRRLCDRYSFAYYEDWGRVLDGWLRPDASGTELIRTGIASLEAHEAFARMPYWLSLLADRLERDGRPDAAAATLDAALAAGRAHDDVWWDPEVLRRRAAHDDPARAVERLQEGARLATRQGSVALLARCRADLEARGASEGAFAVRPGTGTPTAHPNGG
ncbi:ATP-binding protein, partial [Pseudonocardia lutea]